MMIDTKPITVLTQHKGGYMSRIHNRMFVTAAALLGSLLACAAYAASAFAPVGATIVSAIAISDNGQLHFGACAPSATSGTVTVDPTTGARVKAGGVTLSSVEGSSAAALTVTGDASATYSISLPVSNITLTRQGGTETMQVGNFTSDPMGSGQLSGGSQVIKVGARLGIGANQVAGVYSGQFSVSVDYN